MAWIYLLLAGLFEVAFTTCLKESNNFTDWKWTSGFVVCAVISLSLLNKAIQSIPLGTGYAVWTGIGAVGTVLVGIFWYQEPTNFLRLFFIALLLGSIVGLKLVSAH